MVAHSKSVRGLKVSPRTIAPSQLKKMVRIEFISSSVIPCTARQGFYACGLSVSAGEKYFLVQSDRFQGYAYIVRWSDVSSSYQCSCGNPRCAAHIKQVSTYVHAHPVQPKKETLPGSIEAYAQKRDDRMVQKSVEIVGAYEVAQIRETFTSAVVDAIATSINAQFGKTVVRRGIFLLSQKEVA